MVQWSISANWLRRERLQVQQKALYIRKAIENCFVADVPMPMLTYVDGFDLALEIYVTSVDPLVYFQKRVTQSAVVLFEKSPKSRTDATVFRCVALMPKKCPVSWNFG